MKTATTLWVVSLLLAADRVYGIAVGQPRKSAYPLRNDPGD